MNKKRFIVAFLILITFASCKKEPSRLEFEKNVFYSLFNDLADSLNVGSGLLTSPPIPPIPIFDKDENIIGYKETKKKDSLKNWRRILEKVAKKDTLPIFIAIDIKVEDFINIERINNFPVEGRIEGGYKIDLKKLVYKPNITFLPKSDFPEGSDLWMKNYDFNFAGVISFSRITFNKERNLGLLLVSENCGRMCCGNYLVSIKKVKNKWKITKFVQTTVC